MTTENKVINGGKNPLIQEGWTGGSLYSCANAYDLNGTVTGWDLPTGARVTFTMDACGRITSDTAGSSYSWNSDGRLTGRSGVLGTLAWNYHYAGHVTSTTLNDGILITGFFRVRGHLLASHPASTMPKRHLTEFCYRG